MRVTLTEIQNDFNKYLNLSIVGEEIIITQDGKDIFKLIPCDSGCFIYEEVASYNINSNNKMSYEEFIEMTKDSELRYELIDGELYFLTSPNFFHQKVIYRLISDFHLWFKDGKCQPLTAPFDVTLVKSNNINVVQPDIIVICDDENVDTEGKYHGVPTLVLEVLSKSTRRKDLIKKLDLYMETGVKEYWIVDPENKTVQLYSFNENKVTDCNIYKGNDTLISVQFKGLEIKVSKLFD